MLRALIRFLFIAVAALSAGIYTALPGGAQASHWMIISVSPPVYVPYHIILGADKNIWFAGTIRAKFAALVRTAADGTQTDFPLSRPTSRITALAQGPDGNVWFAVMANQPRYMGVGTITPNGTITEYPLPNQSFDNRQPLALTAGPDGNVWVTRSNDEIDRVTTGGVVTRFALAQGRFPFDIVTGSDGNLWFSEAGADAIGRITPSGSVVEFALPNGAVSPTFIARAQDGNVYFAVADQSTGGENIGRITPGGTITIYTNPLPVHSIDGLTVGSDGALWLPETGKSHSTPTADLGRMTLGGVFRTIPTQPSARTGLFSIASGADGKLWITEGLLDKLAVYSAVK